MERSELEDEEMVACTLSDDEQNIDHHNAFSHIYFFHILSSYHDYCMSRVKYSNNGNTWEELGYVWSYSSRDDTCRDERIQRVLGHYRKHFEGEPFAKCLSVRFGRYGSFLPAFSHSPITSSLQEISQDVWSHSPSRFPQTVPSGAAQGSSPGPSIEPLPKRPGPASITDHPKSAAKTFPDDNLMKINMPEIDSVDKPSGQTNHAAVEFRIKLGADALLAQRNAEIYRSLGLDNSSSSSSEGSPDCRGNLMEARESPIKSPSCIIESMTSFPIFEDAILSPLHDSLVYIIEKESILNNNECRSVYGSPLTLMDEFISSREMPEQKELTTRDKSGTLDEGRWDNYENPLCIINWKSKVSIQNSACKLKPRDSKVVNESSKARKYMNKYGFNIRTKSESYGVDLHEDFQKAQNRKSNLSGKVVLKENENRLTMAATPLNDGDSFSVVENAYNNIDADTDGLEGRSDDKGADCTSTSEACLSGDLNPTSPGGHCTYHNASSAEFGPSVNEENWVHCDDCQKWRLLPRDTNPKILPKKWICSMLDWLPGMNKCTFSEEETTDALYALHQCPLLDMKNIQHGDFDGLGTLHHNQMLEDVSLNTKLAGGKTECRLELFADAAKQGGSAKILQPAEENRQPNAQNIGFKNEKKPSIKCSLGKAEEAIPLKKSKSLDDNYGLGDHKKTNNENLHHDYITRNCVQVKVHNADDKKSSEYSSSQHSKAGDKDGSNASANKTKKVLQRARTIDERSNRDIDGKKRKLKYCQEKQTSSDTFPINTFCTSIKSCKGIEYYREMKIKEISLRENVTNKNAHQVNYREEGAYIHYPGEMPVNEYELPSKDIHGTKLSQCASEGVISLADALEAELPCGTTTSGSSKVSAIYPNCEAVKASPVNLSFLYPEYSRKSSPLECYSAKADSCLLSSSRKCSKDKDAVISDKSEEEANKKEVYKRSIQFSWFDNNHEMGVKEHLQVKQRLSGDNYKHSGLLPGNSEQELSPWTKEKSLISHSAFGTGSAKCLDVSYLVKDHRTNKIRYKVEHESLDWESCKRKKRYSYSNRGNYDVKLEKFNNRVDRRTLGGHQYNDSSRSYQYGVNENKNLRMNNTSWRNRKFPAEKNSLKHHQRRSSHWFPRNEVHRTEADTRRGNTKYQRQYRNYQDVSRSRRPFLPEDSESSPRLINISDTHFSRKSLRAKVNVSWTRPSQASHRNSWHNLQRHNDMNVPSPTFCYEANNAFEEAEDLKHSANSLRASGLRLESTELFFQAALKYLSGASLLEPHSSGSGKHVEMTSVKIYDTTAKLLEYCAQEYESCKDMACAALAYKCMEVSNMRIIYSNDFIVSKDCHELQVAFQSVPSAESSSMFSANDYNFNNQLGGDYVFNSRSQSKFSQLINFAQYANSAMEASRKSQICFASASRILEDKGSSEVAACIKRVLNYSFHNMDGLLHLVQEAMEALST